jgi:hypothetical protein
MEPYDRSTLRSYLRLTFSSHLCAQVFDSLHKHFDQAPQLYDFLQNSSLAALMRIGEHFDKFRKLDSADLQSIFVIFPVHLGVLTCGTLRIGRRVRLVTVEEPVLQPIVFGRLEGDLVKCYAAQRDKKDGRHYITIELQGWSIISQVEERHRCDSLNIPYYKLRVTKRPSVSACSRIHLLQQPANQIPHSSTYSNGATKNSSMRLNGAG